MARNFKLLIEYDGTSYQGWQRQPGAPSIQQAIESVLQTMTRQPVRLIGSGRTDAGVHALGQVANFECDTRIEPEAFQKGLNSLLPRDIVIRRCSEADPDFHARYDARSKLYRYCIRNRLFPAALGGQYEWWIRAPLDLKAMVEAASHLPGRKDFKAFEGSGSPRPHTIRTITHALVFADEQERIFVEIAADGFLRYMVRNIVGTLVAAGAGALLPDALPAILQSRDRRQAGATAPAQGLCLMKVEY